MRKLLFLGAILAAAAVGCGGGGGGGTPSFTPTAAPTTTPTVTPASPTPTPTATPPAITATGETFPGPAATPIAIGSSGYKFRIIIAPAASGIGAGGATATLDYVLASAFSSDPPFAGIPPYTATTPLVYFGLIINQAQAVTFTGQQGFTVTLPTTAATGSYFISFYDATSRTWVADSAATPGGPGQTITLSGATTPITYAGNTLYAYVLHM